MKFGTKRLFKASRSRLDGLGFMRRDLATPCHRHEDEHQQASMHRRSLHRRRADSYPEKNPGGYCPIHSTGVTLPDDFVVTPLQYVD